MKNNYIELALKWAENYGITDFKALGSKMVYYVNYKEYAGKTAYKPGYKGETYKVIVDLKTGIETRTMLKRYNPKGWKNR
jgi:hypothetical protein